MILSWGRAVKINSAPFVLPPSKMKGTLPSTSPYSNSVIPNNMRDSLQTNNIISPNNSMDFLSDPTTKRNIETDVISSVSLSSSLPPVSTTLPVQGTLRWNIIEV